MDAAVKSPDDPELKKRNIRLAWIHVLVALAIVVGFAWVQASK